MRKYKIKPPSAVQRQLDAANYTPPLPATRADKSKGRETAETMRAALRTNLLKHGETKFAAVLDRCATPISILCTACGTTKMAEQGCKKRWCPVCARRLAAEKVARYGLAVSKMQWPLFLTLTCANDDDIVVVLKRLRRALKAFKRTVWWRRAQVAGGIQSIEITDAASDSACKKRGGPPVGGRWHPHAHLILDCRWLAVNATAPQRGCTKAEFARSCKAAKWELSERWRECLNADPDGVTQDDAITYVARADSESVQEALKYSVKPSDLVNMTSNPGEVIRCMLGLRLTTPFGSCYGLSDELKRIEADTRPKCDCPSCGGNSWIPTATITAAHYSPAAIARRERVTREAFKRSRKDAARIEGEARRHKAAATERIKYGNAMRRKVTER